ncbi:MAG: hypothetical protein WAN35_01900 [Terracidiphilus sp.]
MWRDQDGADGRRPESSDARNIPKKGCRGEGTGALHFPYLKDQEEVKFSLVVLCDRSTTDQIGGRELGWILKFLSKAENILQSHFGAKICEFAGKCALFWMAILVKSIIIN